MLLTFSAHADHVTDKLEEIYKQYQTVTKESPDRGIKLLIKLGARSRRGFGSVEDDVESPAPKPLGVAPLIGARDKLSCQAEDA